MQVELLEIVVARIIERKYVMKNAGELYSQSHFLQSLHLLIWFLIIYFSL